MKKLKVVLAGMGFGKCFLPIYLDHPNVSALGILDTNEELLNRMLLAQLIQLLEADEQELIRLRYFEEQTQVQVAARLGMTQVQVSRAEKRILKKMRETGK